MTEMIERASPVPYYEQLFAILKGRIVSGQCAVGERLPSELELGREFGLARATVRQTLSKLESEGFARRVPRRGVFATTPKPPSGWIVQDAEGFLESQIRHGRTGIETVVVSAGFVLPPAYASEALQLPSSDEVFAIERLRTLEGRVALFSTNWFPSAPGAVVARATEVLEGAASLNGTLRSEGFVPSGARRVIHAMRPPERIARHLGIEPEDPVLRIRSVSWDQNDDLFDYYETWVLTDTVPLEVNISAA